MSTVLHGSLCEEISVGSKADIRAPLSLPAHERSRFAYSAFKINKNENAPGDCRSASCFKRKEKKLKNLREYITACGHCDV